MCYPDLAVQYLCDAECLREVQLRTSNCKRGTQVVDKSVGTSLGGGARK